ncbi:hypothetical protein SK128_020529, partial [Halocaridina rubra]
MERVLLGCLLAILVVVYPKHGSAIGSRIVQICQMNWDVERTSLAESNAYRSESQNPKILTVAASVETSCSPGNFQCRNGRCIAAVFLCDGDNDCRDENETGISSDEAECVYTCPEDQLTCANGDCIPHIWHCDGQTDCADGSDEPEDCGTMVCSEDKFKCSSTGRCIPRKWVCDGDSDCVEDDSDEHPPEGCPIPVGISCPPGQFICPMFDQFEHRCIPNEYLCDGREDCWDGSDEPDSCPPRTCLDSQFTCASGKCIPKAWICNGRDDCYDKSDEINC